MRCNILSNLYIKSNGDIRCDDDFGERVLLGKLDETFSPSKIFHNGRYTHIRKEFAEGRAPWPEICCHCAFFASGEILDTIGKHKRLKKVQIESSLLCNLKCSSCSRIEQIRAGRHPLILDSTLLKHFLTELATNDYQVDCFEFCGQGEPLNHPNFAVLCQLIKQTFANSFLRVITNGNFSASDKLQGTQIDELVVAIDGAHQGSYQQYRINGNFEQCYRFLCDARQLLPNARLIWKYVLFKHNDSDNEIIAAQSLAEKAQADQLRLVNTSHGPYSVRMSIPDPKPLPIVSRLLSVTSHPRTAGELLQLQISKVNGRNGTLVSSFFASSTEGFQHCIDRASLVKHNGMILLCLDGWIGFADKIKAVELRVGNTKKQITPQFTREDLPKSIRQQFNGFRHFMPVEIANEQPTFELMVGVGRFSDRTIYRLTSPDALPS